MNPIFAGFWRRVAAFIIDGFLLSVPNLLIAWAMPGKTAVAFVLNVAIGVAYYGLLHSSAKQATVGKMVFGIKVTDVAGRRLGFGKAAARYFATWLSALILGIGFLMAAFTKKKQALHDTLCGTLVVNVEADADEIATGADTMPVSFGVWATVLVLLVLPLLGGMVASIAIPVYYDYTLRTQVTEALSRVEPLKEEVNAAITARRPIPTGARTLASPVVQGASIAANGQITITLAQDRLNGGKVFMAPLSIRAAPTEWRCWTEGVPPKFMPGVCRE
jgi:uncharacterized RDD family membrane protein YckC/Tfp pilus assembly major pilin PilA